MTTIYYEKVGRRYHPVAMYDPKMSQAMRQGCHLVVVDKAMTSTLCGIDPDWARVEAALKIVTNRMLEAGIEAAKLRPGNIGTSHKYTPKQQAAWEAFVATLPKGGGEYHAHYGSLHDLVDAAVNEIRKQVKTSEDQGLPSHARGSSTLPQITREQIVSAMEDENPEALLWDGFEQAFIGIGRRCGQPSVVAYSYAKCIQVLMERDGMSDEDAIECFEFNTVGGWLGEHTPICIQDTI